MARTANELKKQAAKLASEGGDTLRVEALEAAHRFKRSWIEMASALIKIRKRRAYEHWGYSDLFAYAKDELLLTRRTVEKLTGSYQALQQHAPQVLRGRPKDATPSYDAVDYYARAVGEKAQAEHPVEVLDELHQAVFGEAQPLSQIRRQFNPILFSRDECTPEQMLDKVRACAARLAKLLPMAQLPMIKGIGRARAKEHLQSIEDLLHDLEHLTPAAERSERAS